MIHTCQSQADVAVDDATFKRYLRFPPTRPFEGTMAENATWARDWYAEHGRPWVMAFAANDAIRALTEPDHWPAEAELAVVVTSAGPEAEDHAAACWDDDEPDRYYFLECYASAVVDTLLVRERKALGASRHRSPGYPDWSIGVNVPLVATIKELVDLPGPLSTLESGMLVPKKSQIAVFPRTTTT
jgi:hypothetical protein